MKLTFDATTLDLTTSGKTHRVQIGEDAYQAEVIRSENGRFDLQIIRLSEPVSASQTVTAYVSSDNAKRWVTINGQTIVLTKSSGARQRGHGHHHAAGELTAPMPGQVRAVNVEEGDTVTKGQTLMVLEAMKMEIRVQSPGDGMVKRIFVRQGQTVEREQVLAEIAEE